LMQQESLSISSASDWPLSRYGWLVKFQHQICVSFDVSFLQRNLQAQICVKSKRNLQAQMCVRKVETKFTDL
jgi:hypothetical protein